MKAVVVRGPADFGMEDVPEPRHGDYEALVRVSHCGICSGTDRHIIAGPSAFPWIAPYPTILGHESIGRVVAVGKAVRYLREGDVVLRPVAVRPGETLGGYSSTFGGMAESGLVADSRAILEDTPRGEEPHLPAFAAAQQVVPPSLNPAGAGAFITFKETLSWAQDFGVGPGARVAVLGVGGVGLSFVRVCKLLGAEQVIAVGRRPWPLQVASQIGADYALNTIEQALAEATREATAGRGCTHVIDAVGDNRLLQEGLALLAPGGKIGQYGVPPSRRFEMDWSSAPSAASLHFIAPREERVHGQALDWVRLGLFDPMSLVDTILPIGQVADAFDLLERRYAIRVTLSLEE